MKIPDQFFYTKEHMWTQALPDGNWIAGVTDYAQDLLGDVVFIDPPKVGTQLVAGTACGLIESVKTGSDLHAPMDGQVIEVNDEAQNAPEMINDKPYKSWIFKFEATKVSQSQALLSADDYKKLIEN